jgi:hypothetical protein
MSLPGLNDNSAYLTDWFVPPNNYTSDKWSVQFHCKPHSLQQATSSLNYNLQTTAHGTLQATLMVALSGEATVRVGYHIP